jgi:amylosucrase
MPVFESPANASDGGYAVSDFRKIDSCFGRIEDLKVVRTQMDSRKMFLMLDIVLNHTSEEHEWAVQAKKGDAGFQDYYYFFQDRSVPDMYDLTMPEIFPESAPGNFSFVPECNQWVMTVFHDYQWDLNYTNPLVFVSMLENILFYANLGVDILRIDAPAFIWKKIGTTSQNLPEAHTILRLIKLCVEVVAPGMAILGEAIVAPVEIMKYFGTGDYETHECDFAYNATQMALQWDALATSETRLMLSAQQLLLQKPFGTSWITYTRSHDDIGFGFGDDLIYRAGFSPYHHRKFLKDFFSGTYPGSFARGALFSNNPKTDDARISGTLASLCGLEEALEANDDHVINLALSRILLMQAMSFSIGGLPMLFSGDEMGAVNNYSYLKDPDKNYDNRWMHRPETDWERIRTIGQSRNAESFVFGGTKKLIRLRRELGMLTDLNNIEWLQTENIHVAGFIRRLEGKSLYCLFNFSDSETSISWWVINRYEPVTTALENCWTDAKVVVGEDNSKLFFKGYQFFFLKTTVE